MPPISRERALSARKKRSKMRGSAPGSMPRPSSTTRNSALLPFRFRSTRTAVPGSLYLIALSMRIVTSSRRRVASPLTVSGPSASRSSEMPLGSARSRIWRAASCAIALKSTVAMLKAAVSESAWASVSICPTRALSRSVSPMISPTEPMFALTGCSRWRSRISALARISESGVRSSCEASATKPRWRSIACCIGRRARPASQKPAPRARRIPAPPPTARMSSRPRRAFRSGSVLRPTSSTKRWSCPRSSGTSCTRSCSPSEDVVSTKVELPASASSIAFGPARPAGSALGVLPMIVPPLATTA